MPDLTGKVALVTGGARRVGRAIVEALAEDGAWVAVHYHTSEADAREVVEGLIAESRQAAAFAADLRDAAAAEALPRQVLDAVGRLDILVNSAAGFVRTPLGSVTPRQWDDAINLTLRGAFFVSQGAAAALRTARGSIINISDLAAFQAWPSYIPHAVSKAGIETLTRGLAQALAPDVTVNAIAPGAVLLPDDTSPEEAEKLRAEIPLGRIGEPRDVVRAVRYLLSAPFVTGTTLVVDGGRLLR